jgi:PLD-like domain
MAIHLVYHSDADEFSPFDNRAIEIAKATQLSVACPYLSLGYLTNRLLAVASSWRLITDIEQWLASVMIADRQATVAFVVENSDKIRNHQGLHAKVLIGNGATMIGSANFTKPGMTSRTEMGVFTDNVKIVREVSTWFENLWSNCTTVESSNLNNLIKNLPNPASQFSCPSLTPSGQVREAALVPLEPHRQLFGFWGAVGYQSDLGGFYVMKWSPARSYAQNSYRYASLREK